MAAFVVASNGSLRPRGAVQTCRALRCLVAPKLTQVLLNSAYNMFPDSSAAQGKKSGEPQPLTAEQMAFAQITQGIHW